MIQLSPPAGCTRMKGETAMADVMQWDEFVAIRSQRMGRNARSKYRDFVESLQPGEVRAFTDYKPGANLAGVRSSVLSAARRAGLRVLTTINEEHVLFVGREPTAAVFAQGGRKRRATPQTPRAV